MIRISAEILAAFAYVWLGMAVIVYILMFHIKVPFGRHSSERWGRTMNNKLGWMVMEFPSWAIMTWFLVFGSRSGASYVWILFAAWLIHYTNRTFVYPLRIRATPKKIPVVIVANAIFFNCINAGMNGYFLAELANPADYDLAWLGSWHFQVGAALFIVGLAINWISDSMLIRLRKPGETGYRLPEGFLFKYVASPNLFGEIVEWLGFFLMAWNLPALCFLVWTFANLVPRAKNHWDWSRSQFPDFPDKRKVLFPFLY